MGGGDMKRMLRRRVAMAVLLFAVVYAVVATVPGTVAAAETPRLQVTFPDVNENDWYVTQGYLDYVVGKSYLSGYSDGRFGPGDALTRGQVVTVLWRMAGRPLTTGAGFSDIGRDSYCYQATLWAREHDIASGYLDGRFGPDDPVTREQLAKLVALYASYRGVDVSGHSDLSAFSDASSVSDWARPYVAWCFGAGIITGNEVGDKVFSNPADYAQRCQFAKVATILDRDVIDDETSGSLGDVPAGVGARERTEAVTIPIPEYASVSGNNTFTATWGYLELTSDAHSDVIDSINGRLKAEYDADVREAKNWVNEQWTLEDGKPQCCIRRSSLDYLNGPYVAVRISKSVTYWGTLNWEAAKSRIFDLRTGEEVTLYSVLGITKGELDAIAVDAISRYLASNANLLPGGVYSREQVEQYVANTAEYLLKDEGVSVILQKGYFFYNYAGSHEVLVMRL